LVLDQVLGEAAASSGHPGMTATLSVRYRRPTPLGPLRAEAEVTSIEGIKTYVAGRVQVPQPDGTWQTSVEAEGVFILPRWAREREQAGEAGDTGDTGDTGDMGESAAFFDV
jgi:acyl-coenzyme A thioesterase PaaI-like protein